MYKTIEQYSILMDTVDQSMDITKNMMAHLLME